MMRPLLTCPGHSASQTRVNALFDPGPFQTPAFGTVPGQARDKGIIAGALALLLLMLAPAAPHIRLSTTSRPHEGVDGETGKWRPGHVWTTTHDMIYAKLCYAVLLFRSPRKSNYIIMKGKNGGYDVYAFNQGFLAANPTLDLTGIAGGDYTTLGHNGVRANFIATPDTVTAIPSLFSSVPDGGSTFVMLGGGFLAFGFFRRRST